MFIANITEAKAKLSALIARVLAGEQIILGKAGRPVAKLVRIERPERPGCPRLPGALKGKIHIADNFEDLPDDLRATFGMDQP